jgi:hypothetical protein
MHHWISEGKTKRATQKGHPGRQLSVRNRPDLSAT